ncbi:Uncharacterised protein at_DN0914 [Pycnogonum litorale]
MGEEGLEQRPDRRQPTWLWHSASPPNAVVGAFFSITRKRYTTILKLVRLLQNRSTGLQVAPSSLSTKIKLQCHIIFFFFSRLYFNLKLIQFFFYDLFFYIYFLIK